MLVCVCVCISVCLLGLVGIFASSFHLASFQRRFYSRRSNRSIISFSDSLEFLTFALLFISFLSFSFLFFIPISILIIHLFIIYDSCFESRRKHVHFVLLFCRCVARVDVPRWFHSETLPFLADFKAVSYRSIVTNY